MNGTQLEKFQSCAKMNDLKTWQNQMGYTYESASEALGVARSTYAAYVKNGAPRSIMLACSAIANSLEPYSEKQQSKK